MPGAAGVGRVVRCWGKCRLRLFGGGLATGATLKHVQTLLPSKATCRNLSCRNNCPWTRRSKYCIVSQLFYKTEKLRMPSRSMHRRRVKHSGRPKHFSPLPTTAHFSVPSDCNILQEWNSLSNLALGAPSTGSSQTPQGQIPDHTPSASNLEPVPRLLVL